MPTPGVFSAGLPSSQEEPVHVRNDPEGPIVTSRGGMKVTDRTRFVLVASM